MLALLVAALIASPVQLSLVEGSSLVIEGDSSIHAWKCDASKLEGQGSAADGTAAASSLSSFKLGVPVGGISCGNGTMEGKLRDALLAEQFARIVFTFTSATLLPGAAAGTEKVKLTGKLAVAGAERNVTAVVTVVSEPGNRWTASGAVPLAMTAYGIEPPSAMLGLMKTKDRIVVRFSLKLQAASHRAAN